MHPGEAPHCSADDMKRVLSREAADAMIAVSEGGLQRQRCTVGDAWHVTTDDSEQFLAVYRAFND